MMDSTEEYAPPASYREAKSIPDGSPRVIKTCVGAKQVRTATVSPTKKTVQMRIVPRPPRQRGDEATTD